MTVCILARIHYKAVLFLSQDLHLKPGEDSIITVMYDSTYCVDKHSRVENCYLTVSYKEHPQKVRLI